MIDTTRNEWVFHYKNKASLAHVYPEGFVVRMFRSRFPEPFMDRSPETGAKILDLFCGYGRNLPFLLSEGFDVYASEIDREIVVRLEAEFEGGGVQFDVGWAHDLPYENDFFDGVLACNSCYYIEEGLAFEDNLREIARVIKPGGFFGGTALSLTHSIFNEAEQIAHNCALITDDQQGIREKSLMAFFTDEQELKDALDPHFESPRIASLREDFAGFRRHLYYFVATRRL